MNPPVQVPNGPRPSPEEVQRILGSLNKPNALQVALAPYLTKLQVVSTQLDLYQGTWRIAIENNYDCHQIVNRIDHLNVEFDSAMDAYDVALEAATLSDCAK